MSPEQAQRFYTPDEARARLGIDETQLNRLTATMRAPLWYLLGDQTVYARATIDRMAQEGAASGRVAPSAETRSLASIIEDQVTLKVGEGSQYVRQLQEATHALLEAFRAMDNSLRQEALTELQAKSLTASINDLATKLTAAGS